MVKDLIAARLASGLPLLFEVDDVTVHELETERPRIRFRHDGERHELECDVIAGCDGFHGVCRPSIPDGCPRARSRATTRSAGSASSPTSRPRATSSSTHTTSAASRCFSLRSPTLSRLYVQCEPDEDLAEWPDDRIWEELQRRLGVDGWTLAEGPILEKGVTGMRSFVVEPMQYGRLFLAGDAAHIVPPTGAKGLNLAIADVRVLAEALVAWYETGSSALLELYSDTCLRRVWRAEHFSWWMTSMLHRLPGGDPFDLQLQLSQLRYVATSRVPRRRRSPRTTSASSSSDPGRAQRPDLALARGGVRAPDRRRAGARMAVERRGDACGRVAGAGLAHLREAPSHGARAGQRARGHRLRPARRLTLRSLGGPVKLTIDHELAAVDGGTRLTVVASGKAGSLMKLAEPMIARTAEAELRGDFERLKELLEGS